MVMYHHHRKQLDNQATKGRLYQIFVGNDADFPEERYHQFFKSFYMPKTKKWYEFWKQDNYDWLTFEIHGTPEGIRLYSWLSGGISEGLLQSNINSVHSSAEIQEVDDYARFGRLVDQKNVACATLTLKDHFLYSLVQTSRTDLMVQICSAMQGLDQGEEIGIQFIIRPVYITSDVRRAYKDYQDFGKPPHKWLLYPASVYSPYLQVIRNRMKQEKKDTTYKPSPMIDKKAESGEYFDLMIRIFTVGKQAKERLSTVISSLKPLNNENTLHVYSKYKNIKWEWAKNLSIGQKRDRFLQDYCLRHIHTYPIKSYVIPNELTTMFHFPAKYIPNVVRLALKKLPVPTTVFKYNSIQEAWKDRAIIFGKENYRGRNAYIAFKDLNMLMQHTYCIGGTGAGKSYWLSFLALQIATIAKTGFTFFDVKGDVADDLLRHLPPSEWDRVVYIDLQDSFHFLPFNILKQEDMSVYKLTELIVSTFIKVFSEGSIKEHSQNVLRNALIAVISTDPDATLLEVYRLLTDEGYLVQTLNRMQEIEDYEYHDTMQFWMEYSQEKPKTRRDMVKAILNKLALIVQNERPRYTFAQKENKLNWRQMMDEKKIILVNLSMGQNEPQILDFFGTLFSSFISKATFSRDDTARDERIPHIFFLDEFQRFVRTEDDMTTLLELARSYGLGLTLAHQSVAQLPNKLLRMIKDNTFTQIALPVGEASAPEISSMLSTETTKLSTSDLKAKEKGVYGGYGLLRLLSPEPFSFESIDMSKVFNPVSFDQVQEWKQWYKEQEYSSMDEVKKDINVRYQFSQKLLEQWKEDQEEEKTVKLKSHTGKLSKKELIKQWEGVL